MGTMRVGVVGCGNISDIYIQNILSFNETTVTCVSDIDEEKAVAKGNEHGVRALPVRELLASTDVDLVLNLTIPRAHFSVARDALEARKHVYNEKPLALSRKEGKELLSLANAQGVLLGGAPDTFLGAGIQTCIGLVDSGEIGTICSGQAFMMCPGHESWHPAPEFYYQQGGGPLFDMGPYYVTALVSMLGSIRRISAVGKKTFATRTITSFPLRGKQIEVEIPTHLVGILEFENGAVVELTTSFDVWHHTMPPLTLHGTKGSLLVGDPNTFGDKVSFRRAADAAWQEIPFSHGYKSNSRGLGVLDMAEALRGNRPHRASGGLVYHVLDAMITLQEAAEQGRALEVESKGARPEPMAPLSVKDS